MVEIDFNEKLTLGIIKKITSQHAKLFCFIRHQHIHLIARYETNILLRLKQKLHTFKSAMRAIQTRRKSNYAAYKNFQS